jgi:hypothetical protein
MPHGTTAPVQLADRTIYSAARADGRTAPETGVDAKASAEISALWNYVSRQVKEH